MNILQNEQDELVEQSVVRCCVEEELFHIILELDAGGITVRLEVEKAACRNYYFESAWRCLHG